MRITKVIAIVVILVLVAALGFAEEGSKGILYRVQNGENTVYLLGSIHVGNEEMYPLGEAIQQAMAASDTFVFECDTISAAALEDAMQLMYYTDGTQIEDVISPELYGKLEDVCEKIGYPIKWFSAMRPWAAMTQFSMQVTAAEMGVDKVEESVRLGVEAVVRAYATENKRAIGYLETTRRQLEYFDSMSMPLQEYLLDETLTMILYPEALQGMDATIRDWPAWWRAGDIAAFVDSYQFFYLNLAPENPTAGLLSEYHNALVTRRNQTMADTVEGYLRGEGTHTYFVTAGLLHLVLPEDSIVKALGDRGYTVECLSVP